MNINSKRKSSVILVVVILMILSLSCGLASPPETKKTAETIETEVPLAEIESEDESIQTEMQPIDQDALIAEWQPVILSSMIVSATCDSASETAKKLQSNEIDGLEAFGELLVSGVLLKGIEDGFSEWTLSSENKNYKNDLQENIDSIQEILGQWVEEEISSSDVPILLDAKCKSSTELVENIVVTAKNQGLSEKALETMVEEMQSNLEEMAKDDLQPELSPEEPPQNVPQEKGFSRSNPFPLIETVNAPNWDIKVVEIVRGDEAWQAILSANQFNDPPPEGMEYILLKVQAKCTYNDSDEHMVSRSDFKLTGDKYIAYSAAYTVNPSPELDAYLYTDGETEGWLSYLLPKGEGNLILIFDELMNFEENRIRYIALDEEAQITIPNELQNITPTDIGKDRNNPIPLGEKAITNNWELTLLEVIRGEDAWLRIQEANQFNDPPIEGVEYSLVKVRVRNIGITDKITSIDSYYFKSTGSANVLYDLPSVVEPEPMFDISLFPGGEYEGWVVFQNKIEETNLVAVFEPYFDLSGQEKRFLSLGQ